MKPLKFKWTRLALVLVLALLALGPLGHTQLAKAFNPAGSRYPLHIRLHFRA